MPRAPRDLAGLGAAHLRPGLYRDEALARRRRMGAARSRRRGAGLVAIFFGLDTGFLTQISLANTASLEQSLVDRIHPAQGKVAVEPSSSVVMPEGGGAMMSANLQDDERQRAYDGDERQSGRHDEGGGNPCAERSARRRLAAVARRHRRVAETRRP
jgi:hypothetical protein